MLLTVKQMRVTYGKQTALDIDTAIGFEKGERIGIIGANGAGKTTFVKALLGLVPYEGSVSTNLVPEQLAAHMQFNEYVTTMPVKYIMETILDTKICRNEGLKELIRFFDFQECLSKRYSLLSGGQKQRFTIIMVMMQDAPLTFYDEVTSGLDFETRQRLMEKLVSWYENRENTLVIVSHYYEELEQLADKILLLDQGRVIAYGKKEELFQAFCGDVIYVLDNNEKNRKIAEGFRSLKAPEHLIALSCTSMEEEKELLSILTEKHINYKRSHSDIEIMSINAKAGYEERQKRNGGICDEGKEMQQTPDRV